jgi:hypothetical protein
MFKTEKIIYKKEEGQKIKLIKDLISELDSLYEDLYYLESDAEQLSLIIQSQIKNRVFLLEKLTNSI